MGNNLWIQKHIAGGETVPLDEAIVEEIFGRHAARREADGWLMDLGSGEGGELHYRAGGSRLMLAMRGL